jgi:hypothetical protein
MEVISWSDAKRRGLMYYFTGVPCVRGHVSRRFVGNSKCVACRNEQYADGGKERERMRRAEAKSRKRTSPRT